MSAPQKAAQFLGEGGPKERFVHGEMLSRKLESGLPKSVAHRERKCATDEEMLFGRCGPLRRSERRSARVDTPALSRQETEVQEAWRSVHMRMSVAAVIEFNGTHTTLWRCFSRCTVDGKPVLA